MLINAQRLVDKARVKLLDTSGQQQGNSWSDTSILDALNEEQDGLVADCIEGSEDYFMAKKDLALQDGVNSYPLFGGFLLLRKLEFVPAGSADPASDSQGVIESRLIEGVEGAAGIASSSDYYYAIAGDNLDIQPTPGAGGGTMSAWIIRAPGPILLEKPATIPTADTFTLSSEDAPYEDDIMVGTIFQVTAGIGIKQRRRCTAYVGSTRLVTLESAFTTPLDATSVVASISRLPQLFHQLLYLGAVVRCLSDARENTDEIKALYNPMYERYIDFVERARSYAQRGAVPFDPEDGI